MEYEILYADGPDNLVKKVRGYLVDGWRPLGGVTACVMSKDVSASSQYGPSMKTFYFWAQAMVRPKDEPGVKA